MIHDVMVEYGSKGQNAKVPDPGSMYYNVHLGAVSKFLAIILFQVPFHVKEKSPE